jgi:2-polyprenyl-3-methyl-5-hydroxy-6-metoxy-1,4-benzoquinol methylase
MVRGLDYIIGKVETAPLASGSFDVVLALDVLEHSKDDAAGLREAADWSNPEGCC